MRSGTNVSVRISAASPEADLSAVVRPGVSTIYYPRVESADQIHRADVLISELEKRGGIRPRTVELRALIETPKGVSTAREIAASCPRLGAIGVGPTIHHALGGDALTYASSEVELHARAVGLEPIDVQYMLD